VRSLPTEKQILAKWQGHIDEPVVSVCCMTYNHGPYIEDALEGFLIQETEFPFEILIHDDASVDNTADIIRQYKARYPVLIRPIYQTENQYSKGVKPFLDFVIPKAKGKYIALCEGDDFWVCSTKLQKQVLFLESNPEYGLVHGEVNHLYQTSGKYIKHYNKINAIHIPQGEIFDKLFHGNHLIKTMTVCFRKNLFEAHYIKDPEIMSKPWRGIDISIWLTLAFHSKIFYIDEVLATYRLIPESMSRSDDPHKLFAFHQTISAIKFYFAEKYQLDSDTVDLLKERSHRSNLFDAYRMRDRQLSRESFDQLKKLKKKITFKDRLFYLAAQSVLLRWVVEIIRKVVSRRENRNIYLTGIMTGAKQMKISKNLGLGGGGILFIINH
jgi:glycosyltransferase involved in cell wall biosynthesis